jgi:hypothetical protein
VPIILVEAEKSVLSLTAWAERVGRKILPIALGGVYGWRGKQGIKETANGERVPETGPIPDLNVCRDGRVTFVLLDANCRVNPMVQAARRDLVAQLRKQEAEVRILDLPARDGINGPDDLIAIRGDEAMTKVLDGEVDGASLLSDVEAYIRRFLVLTPEQSTVLAIYVLHTHVFAALRFTPYIQVWSAIMQSGKTRLLEVLKLLVANPWMTERTTAAALVRKIAKDAPTFLLDESDTAFSADKEYSETLRGILNAGFQKGGCANVCVKRDGDWVVDELPVYSPKVIAGIGMEKLPGTVRDRSIPIELKRRIQGREHVADFELDEEIDAVRPLVVIPEMGRAKPRAVKVVAQTGKAIDQRPEEGHFKSTPQGC